MSPAVWFVFIPGRRGRALFTTRGQAHARRARANGYRARIGWGTGDVEPGRRAGVTP